MPADGGPRAGRALWFTAPGRAELLPEPVRPPGEGEVTVRTIVSLISAGTELTYFRGHTDPGADLGQPAVSGAPRYPVRFAYLCVGRVIEAGRGARRRAGDLVFVRHPHQDVFTVPVDQSPEREMVVALPPGIDPEAAMFLNLVEVAVNAVLDAPVMIGDVAVVFGLGVVGLLVLQLARRTAGRLIAVDPLARRRALALALGADRAVTPDEVHPAVRAATGGRGADVVFEASGAPPALQQAIRAAGREAKVAVISFYGTRPVEVVLTPEFHMGRQRIVSSQVSGINGALRPRWDYARRTATAIDLLPTLRTAEMITHRIPFVDAPEAFRLVDTRPGEVLAVALTYD